MDNVSGMDRVKLANNPMNAKSVIEQIIKPTGITINGHQPWDVQIYNEDFYSRVINEGSLGLGESYMEKWWDCERLDILFEKILRAQLDTQVKTPLRFKFQQVFSKIVNLQTRTRAKQVAYKHYDLGNDLFKCMLDKQMMYSCGYWKNAQNLDEAQTAKLELICQKLDLKPGMRLLDIGCGWGGLAKYAAEKHGVHVIGVTISAEQQKFAREYCKGLPIEILLKDYRDMEQKFDRIVSVGMFEHVGRKNYDIYMKKVHHLLSTDGLFLLHTIGSNQTIPIANEWIIKYIFPNGMLPSGAQISKAAEKYFIMEDWHNFGADYDHTLMAWHQNFTQNWEQIKNKYDERFYRMWSYYLLSCAGSFRARGNQLWQIVFSKQGLHGGYQAPR